MGRNLVTLRDVAAAAEVSVSTASKVLNGIGRVAPATRERIWAAAQRLDFQPNALARSFATGRSLTVGLLTKSAASTFSMPVLIGANAALGSVDMATLMYDAKSEPLNAAKHLRKLQSRQVDGILIVGDGLGSPLPSVSSEFDVPVVYVFGYSDNESDVSFLPNSRMAGRLAGQYLLQIGRSRIAHVTASHDRAASERAEGLVEVLHEAGHRLALGGPLQGDWTRRWGAEAARRILASGERVDAIFCGDDWIALGAQAVLRAAGVRIPDDIALIGFDNLGGLVGRPENFLTTIDPCLAQLGASAAQYLLEAMSSGQVVPGTQYQDCVLIPRGSTESALMQNFDEGDPTWES
jgi:LacI family transcriptional regulator